MKPYTKDEILRQPLFLNSQVLMTRGYSHGIEKRSRYKNWSRKGIKAVRDIWDNGNQRFFLGREIYKKS